MSSVYWRRMAWAIHHWAGFKLSLFMSFVLLTGTFAVFGYEFDWLLHKGMRAHSAQENPNWDAMWKSLLQFEPNSKLISLNKPRESYIAPYAVYIDGDEQQRLMFFDAETGNVTGRYHYMTIQRYLRFIHRHLLLPTKYGVPIVSSLSLLLFALFFSSFFIYRHWWKGFFRFPKKGARLRTWVIDLHRLLGVWSLWFVLLMALTGFWYLVESLGGRAPPHPKVNIPLMQISQQEMANTLQSNLLEAQTVLPELKIRHILAPKQERGAFVFQGDLQAILVRPRSNAVWTEFNRAEVALVANAKDLNLHQRISEMADPLHFGYLGGFATKLLWFIFGLSLSALCISGTISYAIRLVKKSRQKLTGVDALILSYQAMGIYGHASTVALLMVLILFIVSYFFTP